MILKPVGQECCSKRLDVRGQGVELRGQEIKTQKIGDDRKVLKGLSWKPYTNITIITIYMLLSAKYFSQQFVYLSCLVLCSYWKKNICLGLFVESLVWHFYKRI